MKDRVIFTATINGKSSQAMINFIRAEQGPPETFRLHMMVRNKLMILPNRIALDIK